METFVPKTRDKAAALPLLRKLMKRHGRAENLATDGLKSYRAALKELGAEDRQVTGRWENNRVETSQPFRRRERAMLRFRRMHSLQKFAAVHSSVGRCSVVDYYKARATREAFSGHRRIKPVW